MATRLKRRIRAQVRATPEDGAGSFTATVSTYNLPYDIGWGWQEQILPGCFADSIAAQPAIPIFYQHIWEDGPIGVSDEVIEADEQLDVRGHLYLGMAQRIDIIYQAMLDESLREWSIGFWAEEITWDKDSPMLDQIAQGDLAEASVCVRGANPETGTAELLGRGQHAWIEGTAAERQQEVSWLRARFKVPDLGHGGVIERARVDRMMQTSGGRRLLAEMRGKP